MKENNHILLNIIKKIDAAFNFISKISAIISGTLMVIVTIIIAAGVMNRAFIGFQWLFIEEWSSFALIPMAYLAFSYTLRKDRHLNMNMIVRKLPLKYKTIAAIFSAIVAIICLGFMIDASTNWFLYTLKRNVVSSGPMKTPVWIFSPIVVIGLILFMMDTVMYLINQILILKYKNSQLKFYYEAENNSQERKGD